MAMGIIVFEATFLEVQKDNRSGVCTHPDKILQF